ncbi:hypothetical protein A6A12_0768 [Vibrio anguillarum]|nr:hypothetical protein A6A12_0768 [Vibrio anguillarum]
MGVISSILLFFVMQTVFMRMCSLHCVIHCEFNHSLLARGPLE